MSKQVNASAAANEPLMYAAIMGRTQVVKILVHAGADLTAKDSRGETPLMHALAHSHMEVAGLLRAGGA